MNTRSSTDIIRHLVLSIHKSQSRISIRHASSAGFKKPRPEHGQQIFIYTHFQTNQVIYSLTKNLKPNSSLSQLPFTTKKSVPSRLRKDLWLPLCSIHFPPSPISSRAPSKPPTNTTGLLAFQKLRELRRLHELSYDPTDRTIYYEEKDPSTGEFIRARDPVTGDEIEYADGKYAREKKRMRFDSKDKECRKFIGKKIMNQRANCVADLAVVLADFHEKKLDEGKEGGGDEKVAEGKEINVRWSNLLDAEFAETWSENVIHSHMEREGVTIREEKPRKVEVENSDERKVESEGEMREAPVTI